jgi:DNA end-binding protein Ku
MPVRASWKGFLRIRQLAVPVKAFTACKSDPEIPLHQLHRGCHQRIRQQKVCPVHGVLEPNEILSGYEVDQGRYLPLEPSELDELLPDDDKAIAVECFVSTESIDPVYHSGRTYYLVPDEPPGQRPFCVIREGLRAAGRHALARVVIGRDEKLVVLRPYRRLMAMTVLEYAQRVRPADDYEGEVAGLAPGPEELELIGQIIASMANDHLELANYRDRYVDGLNRLIELRLAAETSSAATQPDKESADEEDDAALLAALRASLAAAVPDRTPAPSSPPRNLQPLAVGKRGGARKLG